MGEDNSQKLVLQLNAKALERVIGGDTEVEIGIRQAIVHEFSKRHLKGIIGEPALVKIADELRNDVKRAADKIYSDYFVNYSSAKGYELHSDIKKIITSEVKLYATQIVDDIITERLKSYDFDQLVQKRLDTAVAQRIDSGIKAGIDAAIDKLRSSLR